MHFFSPAEAAPEAYELPAPEPGAAVIQEVVATPTPSPEPTATPVSEIDLVGEWEGYWEMFSASGDWNEMDTLRWDCWAEIDQEDEIYLWDVDLDKDIGLASLMLERDENEIRISEGWFMNSSSGFDQWRVKLQEDDVVKACFLPSEAAMFPVAVTTALASICALHMSKKEVLQ